MESTALSYHFFSGWQECRRAFYFQQIAHLEPPRRKALSIGSALHDAVAAYRSTYTYKDGLWEMFKEASFDSEDERRSAFVKASAWMTSWVETYGSEKGICEEEFKVKVPFGTLSGRIDFLQTEPLVIEDLKTSSYKNAQGMIESEMLSDQLTHYAYLIRMLYGANPQVRILCANLRESLPRAFRSDEWYIGEPQQAEYIAGLEHMFYEIQETVEAFDDNVDLAVAFPRNSLRCSAWGCGYAPLCRNIKSYDIRKGFDLPAGFGWNEKEAIELVKK